MKVSAMAVRIKDVRDGSDVEDGIGLGQRVVAGAVAERAFVAERLARVNVAFDVRAMDSTETAMRLATCANNSSETRVLSDCFEDARRQGNDGSD